MYLLDPPEPGDIVDPFKPRNSLGGFSVKRLERQEAVPASDV